VLIAAKDEEPNIERCLRGMLAQDYPRLRVVCANDRSGDRTGVIIDELAAQDARLTPVHIRELPEGWFGKNHAMHRAVQQATGEWLCFSDADCTYDSPQLLSAAMRFAMREGAEFLSVLPRLEAASTAEWIVQPVAGAIMVFWYPPQRVNDPRSLVAYANGAFMLMSRAAYDRLGGHEPIRATLNEDMHLARRAKQIGVRLRVIRGGSLYSCRMYTGLGQIWRGWSRIFYGCLGTLPRLVGSIAMLTFFSVSPYVSLISSPLAGSAAGLVALAACAAIVCQQSVMWRFYALSQMPPYAALTYPLGAAFCIAATMNALLKWAGAAGTTWRGTSYAAGRGA
jgi:glycosyltransferase involved in cell wall biosynthesis